MKLTIFFLLGVSVICEANACQPISEDRYANSEARVKQRFDSVDSVELLTLVDAKVVKIKRGGIDFEMEAERATFRVDRVFKGLSRVGDFVVFESVGSCAFSVVGNPRFKYVYDVKTRKPAIPDRQWLLYRNAAEVTEITDSDFTRPISQAWFDIKILDHFHLSAAKTK